MIHSPAVGIVMIIAFGLLLAGRFIWWLADREASRREFKRGYDACWTDCLIKQAQLEKARRDERTGRFRSSKGKLPLAT